MNVKFIQKVKFADKHHICWIKMIFADENHICWLKSQLLIKVIFSDGNHNCWWKSFLLMKILTNQHNKISAKNRLTNVSMINTNHRKLWLKKAKQRKLLEKGCSKIVSPAPPVKVFIIKPELLWWVLFSNINYSWNRLVVNLWSVSQCSTQILIYCFYMSKYRHPISVRD